MTRTTEHRAKRTKGTKTASGVLLVVLACVVTAAAGEPKGKGAQPPSKKAVAAPPAPIPAPAPNGFGSHVGRPFGSIGSGRAFGGSHSGRSFGGEHTGRPFAPLGSGRSFGAGPAGSTHPPVTNPTPPLPPPASSVSFPAIPGETAIDPGLDVEGGLEPPVLDEVGVAPITSEPPTDDGVVEVAPAGPPPRSELARRMIENARDQLVAGQAQLAEATLNSALGLHPDDAELRLEYALSLLAAGYVDRAAREVVHSLLLDPRLIDDELNVITPLGGVGAFREQVEAIDRYRATFPLDSYSRFLRGFLALHVEDLAEATEEFRALEKSDPSFPLARAFADLVDERFRRFLISTSSAGSVHASVVAVSGS